jgi:hypothetical protein
MKIGISNCRQCAHYTPEGRRGGNCGQLGVPVQGCWKSCRLAIPPFASSLETVSGLPCWSQDLLTIPKYMNRLDRVTNHVSDHHDLSAPRVSLLPAVKQSQRLE